MAYNKQYYEERRKDLESDFNKSKEKAFGQIVGIVNTWNADAQELQKKFQDIQLREQEELKKETAPDPKANAKK